MLSAMISIQMVTALAILLLASPSSAFHAVFRSIRYDAINYCERRRTAVVCEKSGATSPHLHVFMLVRESS